ncbi:MAG: hypothetical protein CL869_02805 [Cytophagia bacterium]|nr:hypothetical protein [Cytophagia bacterium]
MLKFFRILRIILKAKFVFYVPSHKEILIFDKESQNALAEFFTNKKGNIFILETRKESINFYILYLLIKKREKINYQNYLRNIIQLVKPKIVITTIDNSILFYKIKKFFPDVIFISIQGTIHFFVGDILEILKRNKDEDKYNLDYYFVYSDSYAQEIKKYIKSNYIVIGSIKNNFFKSSNEHKKKTLGYISRFPQILYDYSKYKKINKNNYEIWEYKLFEFCLKLLKNLKSYCIKNKIKLNVIGANNNSGIEYSFYNEILGSDILSFLPRRGNYGSYEKIDRFEVLINPMSSLGYEAIARKKKVAFFSEDECVGSNFGWPIIKEKKGNFYSNSANEDEIDRVISYLFRISEEDWQKEWSLLNKKYFYYDAGNAILKDYLSKIVSK